MDASMQKARSITEFYPVIEDQYYRGEAYAIETGDKARFSLKSVEAGAIPIAMFEGTGMGMRRAWSHIRERACDRYVVWFPIKGSLSITQDSAHGVTCEPGQFCVVYGDRPFHVVANNESGEECRNAHVIVPSHMLRDQVSMIDRYCGRIFDCSKGPAAVGSKAYASLVEQGEEIAEETLTNFAQAALEAVCQEIRSTVSGEPIIVDTKKAHLERVLRCIDKNLPTQGLTADNVAKSCNMSRRYLHYLLKYYDLSFGSYLWEARLKQAQAWLRDPEFSHFNIVDIAYMCGFRSPSHFSSAYRSHFGCSPREGRAG